MKAPTPNRRTSQVAGFDVLDAMYDNHRSDPPVATVAQILADERFAARRADVEARRERPLLIAVGVVFAIGLLCGVAFAALRSPLFAVDRIVVAGATRTTATTALTTARVGVGQQLIDIDPAAVERRLRLLPWVAEATVERHWPGEVRITLRERTGAAVIFSEDRPLLVDESGRVLEALGAAPSGMARIETAPGTALPALEPGDQLPRELATAAAVAARFEPIVLADGRPQPRVRPVAPGSAAGPGVEVVLGVGGPPWRDVVVWFGDDSAIATKHRALASMMGMLETTSDVNPVVLDLRVPDAPARLAPESALVTSGPNVNNIPVATPLPTTSVPTPAAG